MQINKFLKYLRKSKSASGFTLTELLISSFIGALVIGATGYALTNLLQGNKTATAQTNKRTEINRAMEFISDEIRRADTIDVDPAPAFNDTVPSPPTDAQPVLALNIPGVTNAGVESPIIYFLSSPRDGDKSVWKGPKVIYRFGPPLNTAGEYNLKTEVAWTVEPLVDGISEDSATANCDPGETSSPSPINSTLGFYACIVPTTDDPLKGETARIFAVGKLDDGNEYSENYQADTKIFARAEKEDLDGKDTDDKFTAGGCNFTGGALKCDSPKKINVKSLADAFACNLKGDTWWVEITAYYISDSTTTPPTETVLAKSDPKNNKDFEFATDESTANKEILFRVKPIKPDPPKCDGDEFSDAEQNHDPVSSNDDNPDNRFREFRDGDEIDSNLLKAGYGSQKRAIEAFKDPDGNGDDSDSLIDGDKISLPLPTETQDGVDKNIQRLIIAFEMGQKQQKLPDNTTDNPGFDFQDQILLIQADNVP
jgi:type II secretory pathway pseudopilin PulG